jgi:hypothetical protein
VLPETAGTTIQTIYSYAGPITGTQQVDVTVGGNTTFEGNTAVLYTAKTSGTNTVAGQTLAVNTTGNYYNKKTGTAEVTNYGAVITAQQTIAGFSVPTETKIVWSPPYKDQRYTLTLGQSITQSYSGSTTITSGGLLGSPGSSTVSITPVSNVVKFVAVETITVPAGTYKTCKMQEWATATPSSITTSWLIYGNGIQVKSEAVTATGTQTITATSVKVNGRAL